MNKRGETIQRERWLYSYFCALERGDFDSVAAVLCEAECDPALERMILEVNEGLIDEHTLIVADEEAELVRELIRQHLTSALPEEAEEIELPPLTVGDVVSRLQNDSDLWQQARREDASTIELLRRSDELLPENLSLRGVRHLFERLRVKATERFEELFREAAIFLSMGREQGIARLAAARRQRQSRKQKNEEEKNR